MEGNNNSATFGAGCFWCVEAIFSRLKGVKHVEAGYAGGEKENPTYEEVCSGMTGHAEVARIKFDPKEITYEELLEVFWNTHDPTTYNRQGADVGSQYRSVIFYHSEDQKKKAGASKKKADASGYFPSPVVTEIQPLTTYYKAEDYHQEFFKNNPNQAYCKAVVKPKVEKFEKAFQNKL